jgi:preprotein translocase subunit SecG
MTLLINILLGFYVVIAVLMVLVILMQRPKSEGLGAAFGGGVTENLFGAQTTNVLTKITSWLAIIFFLLTFTLSVLYAHKSSPSSNLRRELMKDLPPGALATPTPSPGPSTSATPSGTAANESLGSTPQPSSAKERDLVGGTPSISNTPRPTPAKANSSPVATSSAGSATPQSNPEK